MPENFVAYRLVIDYSLIIGNNQWLFNWLPIDYPLVIHWCHWCHQLGIPGSPCYWGPSSLHQYWLSFERLVPFPRIGLLTPNLEDQGITLRLVSTLLPVQHGWPHQEYKTPADIALKVIETPEPPHHDKVVTPLGRTITFLISFFLFFFFFSFSFQQLTDGTISKGRNCDDF